MRTLITRSISGVVLVSLVLAMLLLGEISALLLLMVVFTISFVEFKRMFQIGDQYLTALLIILGLSLLGLSHFILDQTISAIWITGYGLIALTLVMLFSLISKKSSFMEISLLTLGMLWIAGSSVFVLASGWKFHAGQYDPTLPIVLLALIWINDAGAYLAGSLYGKHQFSPVISPGKTWEGFISGVVFTGLAGWLVYVITDSYSVIFWVVSAVIISLASVAGDLFESKLKREAGVKDSGNVIPGHGGMLDRFDSLFSSAPVFFIIIILWEIL